MLINQSEALVLRERLLEKKKIESTNERQPILLCIGVDVGQQNDPSVFVAVQKTRNHRFLKWTESQTARVDLNDPLSGLEAQYVDEVSFDVVMIRRVRLKTSYSAVVQELLEIVETPQIAALNPHIALDGVSIGRALFEMMVDASMRNVKSIVVTGSQSGSFTDDDPYFTVGKVDVFSTLKALFGRGALKISSALREAPALQRELEAFTVKRKGGGRASYEAAPSATDDIISALALSIWYLSKVADAPPALIAPIEIKRDFGDGLRTPRRVSRGSYSMSNRGNKGHY
jgi:hypothetical protein